MKRMFIPSWGIFFIGFIVVFFLLWVVRLYRHVHRMRRIIWRLEAIEDHERLHGKTGDSEGH